MTTTMTTTRAGRPRVREHCDEPMEVTVQTKANTRFELYGCPCGHRELWVGDQGFGRLRRQVDLTDEEGMDALAYVLESPRERKPDERPLEPENEEGSANDILYKAALKEAEATGRHVRAVLKEWGVVIPKGDGYQPEARTVRLGDGEWR